MSGKSNNVGIFVVYQHHSPHDSRVSEHIFNCTIHGFQGIFLTTRFRDKQTYFRLHDLQLSRQIVNYIVLEFLGIFPTTRFMGFRAYFQLQDSEISGHFLC